MEKKSADSSSRKGIISLLNEYPFTSLIVAGCFMLSALLYVSLRYAGKKTLTPPDATAMLGLSRRLYQEGDYDQTIAINRTLEEQQNHYWQAEMTTGNAYFKKKDYSGAIEHFTKATMLNSNMPLPYLNLALACFHQGQTGEARKWYTYVIEHFGDEYPHLREKASTALECMNSQSAPRTATP